MPNGAEGISFDLRSQMLFFGIVLSVNGLNLHEYTHKFVYRFNHRQWLSQLPWRLLNAAANRARVVFYRLNLNLCRDMFTNFLSLRAIKWIHFWLIGLQASLFYEFHFPIQLGL